MLFAESPDANVVGGDTSEAPAVRQTTGTTGGLTVTCRVCQASVNIEGKLSQHVVKCPQCNEATVRKFKRFYFNRRLINFYTFSRFAPRRRVKSMFDVHAIVC